MRFLQKVEWRAIMLCRGPTRAKLLRILPTNLNFRSTAIVRWLSSSSPASSDYLQTISPVPTMHFQPALPQLPIPSLRDTCQRYLASQHAFLSPEDFVQTKSLVEEFEEGPGVELNKELIEVNKKNRHTSYTTDLWLEKFLTCRTPLVLDTNFAGTLSSDHRPAYMEQTLRATNIIVSLLRFMKTLREDKLIPSTLHKNPAVTDTEDFWRNVGSLSPEDAYRYAVESNVHPLAMHTFPNMFNATRIARPGRDELFKDESKRHILVLCRGHMYVFDVLDKNGSIIPARDIRANLKYVLDHSNSLPLPEHPIGCLTTEDRDTWGLLREKILAVCKDNEDSMMLVDSALFCVCLEDDADDVKNQLLRTGLYGHAENRWFDKSFQLIVMKDGQLMANFEHSGLTGVTASRVFSEASQDSINRPSLSPGETPSSIDNSQSVKKLDFKLDAAICRGVEEAKANHALATSQLSMQCTEYTRYGQAFIKRCGLSPDAVLQLALQIAYHRVADFIPATREPCSTALFKHARTETLRPATAETKRCMEAFHKESGVRLEEKRALVRACSDKHRLLVKEAAMGQGWDRHLFALHRMAAITGKPTPKVFQDPAYTLINTITLFTATVRVPIDMTVIPALCHSGLGVAYQIIEDRVLWSAGSFLSSPSLSDLERGVHAAFDEIHKVISNSV